MAKNSNVVPTIVHVAKGQGGGDGTHTSGLFAISEREQNILVMDTVNRNLVVLSKK